ncbi:MULTISPECIES: transcription termination/antitermination protein NusG [unclassified Bradyrhizobium]
MTPSVSRARRPRAAFEIEGHETMIQGIERPDWFILLTEPQREQKAVDGLKGRCIEAYGPRVMKRLVRRGRKVEVERPLFPGYIFARLVEGIDDFSAPKRVNGVRDYLRFEGLPCALQRGAIDAIRRREEIEMERATRAISGIHNFTVGEDVRVAEGPFSGFAATVFALDAKGAVSALINLFGRKTKVVFDGAQLEKV